MRVSIARNPSNPVFNRVIRAWSSTTHRDCNFYPKHVCNKREDASACCDTEPVASCHHTTGKWRTTAFSQHELDNPSAQRHSVGTETSANDDDGAFDVGLGQLGGWKQVIRTYSTPT